MAKQTINIGAAANDGTGDPLRTAFDKANDNFDELYTADAALGTIATQDANNVTLTGGSISGLTALGVSGNITVTGTVDGRDIATDGTKLDGVEASADVTDTANVTAAGALMDSEVDADIKTLSLPANTTISAFGATLVDDADAGTARTTLGVDAAGTDNSTDVTLAGTPDYITIAGQVITRGQIDLTTDVTGDLPVTEGGTGASDAATARSNLGAEAADADILKADTADVLTAGFANTPYNAGTKSSGTYTPDEADGNMQYFVNGGAFTLAPPTNNCTLILQQTNDGSAGTITTSGFTIVDGDTLTTTNGDDFFMQIIKCNGFSSLTVKALQ